MDPNHYNPYHHPYYRVGATPVKDHHHHHHQSVESAAQAAAVQTRILEMRKEKSRDAARSRRGKENHEFYELAKMLPLPAAITSQLGNALLDKASIIRLTISYLKLRDFSMNGEPSWNISNGANSALKSSKICNVFEVHQGTHILQSLDGFAFALGQDGRFLYISETVSIYLGLSQVEMTGSSIFDYAHPQDQAELAEQLGLNVSSSGSQSQLSSSPLPPASVGSSASNESDVGTPYSNSHNHITTSGSNDTMERQFCIRMKSTLTKRGCQHFKSSGYRVVHIIAHLRPEMHQRRDTNASTKIIGLVAVAIALPPPSINELRLESDMFVTRLGLDFRIAHCEPRVSELLKYTSEELTGRNMYSLIHGQDVIQIRKSHLDLIHKGQVMTNYYRIINKCGGFTWLQTCATLICNNNNSNNSSKQTNNQSTTQPTNSTTNTNSAHNSSNEEQEQSIICVNYVLSGIEYTNVVMDTIQLNNGLVSNAPTNHLPIITKRTQSKRCHSSSTTPSPEANQISISQSVDTHASASTHSSHQSQAPQSIPQSSLAATAPVPVPVSLSLSVAPTSSSSQVGTAAVSQSANGSPHSPVDMNLSESAKRRRFNSSPVRPWKSPSPPSTSVAQQCQLGSSPPSTSTTSSSLLSSSSSSSAALLRHNVISVIRETPAILKPQVVAPTYHPHVHHYHPLVDPYAAAYHLYKNGGSSGAMAAPATPTAPSSTSHHHWGAYN